MTDEEKLEVASQLANWRHRIGVVLDTPVNVNDYIHMTRSQDGLCMPLVCSDGLILSIQASPHHGSRPRELPGETVTYTHVEVMCRTLPEFLPYLETDGIGVHHKVPVELVSEVITNHGGCLSMDELQALPSWGGHCVVRLSAKVYKIDLPFS